MASGEVVGVKVVANRDGEKDLESETDCAWVSDLETDKDDDSNLDENCTRE